MVLIAACGRRIQRLLRGSIRLQFGRYHQKGKTVSPFSGSDIELQETASAGLPVSSPNCLVPGAIPLIGPGSGKR
jgi:hypothetical protein